MSGDILRTVAKATRGMNNMIKNAIGRGVLRGVADGAGRQRLQVELTEDELRDNVERFGEFGFASHPLSGAAVAVVFVTGNRGHGLVVGVEDPRHRPKDMQAGESCQYNAFGMRVWLTEDGPVIDCGGKPLKVINGPKARFEMDVEATGQIKDLCDTPQGRTMASMRQTFDEHVHPENDAGGPTDPPSEGM